MSSRYFYSTLGVYEILYNIIVRIHQIDCAKTAPFIESPF